MRTSFRYQPLTLQMNNLFRGLLAGAGAWKLGGGCFSTVLIFVLLWVLLGQCGAAPAPGPETGDAVAAVVSAGLYGR